MVRLRPVNLARQYATSLRFIRCPKDARHLSQHEWNEFKHLDRQRLLELRKTTLLFEGHNSYVTHEMQMLGSRYRGLGRGYNGDVTKA